MKQPRQQQRTFSESKFRRAIDVRHVASLLPSSFRSSIQWTVAHEPVRRITFAAKKLARL